MLNKIIKTEVTILPQDTSSAKVKVVLNQSQNLVKQEETTFPQFSLNVSNPISWKLNAINYGNATTNEYHASCSTLFKIENA